jgi:uncharacterized SAM-binding protein YcdF (DUF218 family)
MALHSGADRFGSEDDRHFTFAAQRFFKKMEAFGNAPAIFGQAPAGNGPAYVPDQRIGRAGNGLNLGHWDGFSSACVYNVGIRITYLKRAAGLVILLLVVFAFGYLCSLTVRIGRQSARDEAMPANVIIVMGAAEYRGHPSPVLKLRLDHAVDLYERRLAPYIMTTGGSGGDPSFTEGGVGRSYLIDRGIPPESIIVEDEGESTAYSLSAASEILRRMGLNSCIIVSDGYHIFRVKRILQQQGFRVYGSPRAPGDTAVPREWWQYFRQAVAYGLWKVGLRV